MPDFRRRFRPGGTYFFTVVTYGRQRILCTEPARRLLRAAIADCRQRWPFDVPAIVLLPDHLHCLWTLPQDDAEYPKRWAWIKRRFSEDWTGREAHVTAAQQKQRRRGVFQPRYWEHTIRDSDDYEKHFHYIHFNPVKHGLANAAKDWPYSTFHRHVAEGVYPLDWGTASEEMLARLGTLSTVAE